MSAVDLSAVSDERLIEELANRARARAEKKPHDIAWCEDCVHFRVWTRSSEPPRNYNPCSEGHKMQFQMPADHNPYASMGFCRRDGAGMSLRTAIELLLTTPEFSDDETALSPEAVKACEYAHAALAGTPMDPPPVVEGNIADCIATLRRYQAWRRGQPGVDEIAPSLIGRALDAVIAYAEAESCGR